MCVEILGVVVVRQLFTGFNISFCKDEDSLFAYVDLAVGSAGVIDEARRIGADVAVDGEILIDLEQILARIGFHLGFCCSPAGVLDDARAPLYRLLGKEPATAL